MEPGSSAVPTLRNQSGPYRAISARCASVSTFCTSVGRPTTPRSKTRGGLNRGIAGSPLTRLASADSSPARKRGGASMISTGAASRPAAARSATAARSRSCSRALRCTYRPTAAEPTASAASCRPSSTRCGEIHSSDLSLSLAGSPSAPLPITTGWVAASATAASLRCTGNAAPPRPVSPAALSTGMSRPGWPKYGGVPYRARCVRRSTGTAPCTGSSRGMSSGRPPWRPPGGSVACRPGPLCRTGPPYGPAPRCGAASRCWPRPPWAGYGTVVP